MGIVEILFVLFIGISVGWIASRSLKGMGFGRNGNIVVSVIGAAVGTFGGLLLSPVHEISNLITLLSSGIWAVVGALLLLFTMILVKSL